MSASTTASPRLTPRTKPLPEPHPPTLTIAPGGPGRTLTSDWDYAPLKGLDQHSGVQLDEKEWFVRPLHEAYAQGEFPKERLSDMMRRILRSIYALGADKWGPAPDVDLVRTTPTFSR